MQYLKKFNSQPLAPQARIGKQLVSLMPAIRKAFDLVADGIVDLSIENECLKNKIGSYDEKWLQESKDRLLKQIIIERTANLFTSGIKKTDGKASNKCLIYLIQIYGNQKLTTSFPKEINYRI